MRLNKKATISIRNKMTDSTPLHVATEGGYFDVVKKLLHEGASASDENKVVHKIPSYILKQTYIPLTSVPDNDSFSILGRVYTNTHCC